MRGLDADEGIARLDDLRDRVGAATNDLAADTWIVGGIVRDALSGHALGDLDLVTTGDVEAVTRALAKRMGGTPFPLSDRFGCWRIAPQGDDEPATAHIDVCAARGGSLAADLALRDFTVNAMAVPVSRQSRDSGSDLADPHGGREDLAAGVIRAVSDTTFSDDPLRIIRMVRFARALDAIADAHTRELARATAARAAEPSGERIFVELDGVLSTRDARDGLLMLDDVGALAVLLPELDACRDIPQSNYHHLDVFQHTLAVLDAAEDVVNDPEHWLGSGPGMPTGSAFTEFDRQLVRWSALMHDLGKPPVMELDAERGFPTFHGHHEAGVPIAHAICERLATSRALRDGLATIVRTHLALGATLHRQFGDREAWRFLRLVEPVAPAAIALSLADRLATSGPADRKRWLRMHQQRAQQLWRAHWHEQEHGRPQPLLDGTRIITISGLPPGPEIGALVRALEEEQAAGTIVDEAAAIEFIERMAPTLSAQS